MNLLITGVILIVIAGLGIAGCIGIDKLCDNGKLDYYSGTAFVLTYICSGIALLGSLAGISCLVASLLDVILG